VSSVERADQATASVIEQEGGKAPGRQADGAPGTGISREESRACSQMKIIGIRPSKKFKGAWVAFEAPGVEPAFGAPDAKQKAIDYACGRFGGGTGQVHAYGDDGAASKRKIVIDCRGQYPGGK
jgi:hypothetical protein